MKDNEGSRHPFGGALLEHFQETKELRVES